MLSICYLGIFATAGFGKKAERKKVVGRRTLPKWMNSFQANLLLGSKGKRRERLRMDPAQSEACKM